MTQENSPKENWKEQYMKRHGSCDIVKRAEEYLDLVNPGWRATVKKENEKVERYISKVGASYRKKLDRDLIKILLHVWFCEYNWHGNGD